MTTDTSSSLPSRRAVFAAARARMMGLSLRFGWLMFAGFAFAAWRVGELTNPLVWGPMLAVAVVLSLLAVPDWEQAFRGGSGDIVAFLGLVAIGAALSVVSAVPALGTVVLIVYFGVVALLAALTHWTVQIAAAAMLLTAMFVIQAAYGAAPQPEDVVLAAITLGVVAVATATVSREFRREVGRGVLRQRELAERERDLERLYEVSRTIAAGDSLDHVLPALVGKIASFLNAEIGVILLHNLAADTLEVVNPIWSSGKTLEIREHRISLRSDDQLARVFVSGNARRFEPPTPGALDPPGLVRELDAEHALAVPLRISLEPIGVMLVADRLDAQPFTGADLEALTSLAGPAALVLSYLSRFEEAAQTSRQMEELAKLKSDFVSVVSHELRTPLTSIIGSLDTIARPELAPKNPSAGRLLDSARSQAARLRQLIEDLLMTSRLDARALPQLPEELNLPVFLSQLIGEIPGAAAQTKIDIIDGSAIRADPDHLRRMLTNLIQNALKYAPDSPIELVVRPVGEEVVFRVIDRGEGIPAAQKERIFDRFVQLEPATTRFRSGTGLGLAIVKGLVEAMGGRVSLEDTLGGGATFVLTLPRRPKTV